VIALVGTGFCGALTTYSTFSYETLRLLEDGAWSRGAANVLVSMAAGLGAPPPSAGRWCPDRRLDTSVLALQ
jgi:fluoride ion exporter CrcB/FEX